MSPQILSLLVVHALLACGLAAHVSAGDGDAEDRGRRIYENQCAECHGDRGRGNEDFYPDPLIGDDSPGQLAELIADTMPEGEPELCQGDDAEAVAAYIHEAFYSEAAQIRNRPPRLMLQRLTARQLRQSLSDLYATVDGIPVKPTQPGVNALYFDGDRWKKENQRIERIDPFIDFDFGHESPGDEISSEAFYVLWSGALKPERSGRYEIVVHSSLSMTMKFGDGDKVLIDNHVQSGDKTEFRRSLFLSAGRLYPFSIQFIQRKRKTELPSADIRLAWVPPGGVEHTIPTRNLVADSVPPAYTIQSDLPPDDRSYGYPRGISVDRAWDESTTSAALEFATVVYEDLWPRYQRRHRKDDGDDRTKLKRLLVEIVGRAFRHPLDDELKRQFVDRPFDQTPADIDAVKRVLLVALKSPRFLYPTIDSDRSPSRRAANRLALVLHDSIPTRTELIRTAGQDELESEDQIRHHAREMSQDPRTDAKFLEFLSGWLNLDHLHDLDKDQEKFADFDDAVAADSRRSFRWMLADFAADPETRFQDLLTRPRAYTSDRLAAYYGDAWETQRAQAGDRGVGNGQAEGTKKVVGLVDDQPDHLRISVPSPDRRGVLNHPFLTSSLAYHDATSPIHRGVFLIRYMLGRTLRPPNAAFAPFSPDLHPDLTTRQRVELQTGEQSCQVCHSKINPLGFTLENYDATGRHRDSESGRPIDSNGVYESRDGESVSLAGPMDLADYLATSDDSVRGFVNRLFQHFTKQPPAAYGRQTLDQLIRNFEASDYSIRELIVEIATIAAARPLGES